MCGGDCWEIKDKIGGKKISGGAGNFRGGDFWGKCQKRGGWQRRYNKRPLVASTSL